VCDLGFGGSAGGCRGGGGVGMVCGFRGGRLGASLVGDVDPGLRGGKWVCDADRAGNDRDGGRDDG
jgi:hypothetical protein